MLRLAWSFASVLLLSATAFAQPANDECVSAAVLVDGPNAVSTTGATFSGTESSCPIQDPVLLDPALMNPDVWFTYTASCTGDATFAVTNISGDAIFAIYDDCTLLTEIECNDAVAPLSIIPVTAGEDYLVRMFDWDGATGDTTLDVTCVGLGGIANDECAGALPLVDGANAVTTINASFSGTESSCPVPVGGLPVLGNADTWYSYTASCTGDATLSLTNTGIADDVIFAVYDDCTLTTEVACGGDFADVETFPVTAGEDYLVRVFAWNDVGGLADLDVACVGGLAPEFIRGDLNQDGNFGLPDAIELLSALFIVGAALPPCLDTADVDGSGVLGLPDAIFLLNFLFNLGTPPGAPHPACGPQPAGAPSAGCAASNANC